MADNGLWSDFLSNMGNRGPFAGSIAGAGLGALGGLLGRRRNAPQGVTGMSGGQNRAMNQNVNTGPISSPGMLNPSPSGPTPPSIGGDMARPTLLGGPGERTQQIDMGNLPTQPGFKFPSSPLWARGQADWY